MTLRVIVSLYKYIHTVLYMSLLPPQSSVLFADALGSFKMEHQKYPLLLTILDTVWLLFWLCVTAFELLTHVKLTSEMFWLCTLFFIHIKLGRKKICRN